MTKVTQMLTCYGMHGLPVAGWMSISSSRSGHIVSRMFPARLRVLDGNAESAKMQPWRASAHPLSALIHVRCPRFFTAMRSLGAAERPTPLGCPVY